MLRRRVGGWSHHLQHFRGIRQLRFVVGIFTARDRLERGRRLFTHVRIAILQGFLQGRHDRGAADPTERADDLEAQVIVPLVLSWRTHPLGSRGTVIAAELELIGGLVLRYAIVAAGERVAVSGR